MLTTSNAATLIGRSFQAASQAMDRLVDAGRLAQVNVGRRNRAFEAPELNRIYSLASSPGPPVRSQPHDDAEDQRRQPNPHRRGDPS